MAIERILVGINFSARAEIAFTQALNLSRATGATLFVAHALPAGAPAAEEAHAAGDAGVHEQVERTRNRLEAMCRRARAAGVDTFPRVIDAGPDEGIPRLADSLHADLVFIGTHGRSGLRELLAGSVAERVARTSRTGVLVARPRTSARGGYNHILVPTDLSPCADQALAAAVAVVSAGGVVEVVHFWHVPLVAASYWVPSKVADHQRRMLRHEIDALGDELVDRFTDRHQKISFEDEEKPVTTGILERMRSGVYDLVVIASHGRHGLRRWVTGSLAESTLRRAPCSVLVLHPAAAR